MERVIYTCISGGYDEVPLVKPTGDFDYICFLDAITYNKNISNIEESKDIKFVVLDLELSPINFNRFLKIRPEYFLKEYSISIYIDGNIRIDKDPFPEFEKLTGKKPIAIYAQPDRDCAYLEIDELVRVGLIRGVDAAKLKKAFRFLGLPPHYGLFEANILFRRHHEEGCLLLMNAWWNLWINSKIKRDQPYLAFANFLTNGDYVQNLGMSELRSDGNKFFHYQGRLFKKSRKNRFMRRLLSEFTFYRRG